MAKHFQGAALSLLFSLLIIPSIPMLYCPAQHKPKNTAFHRFFFFLPWQKQCLYIWNQNNHYLVFSSVLHVT